MRAFLLLGALLLSLVAAGCGGPGGGATAVPDAGQSRGTSGEAEDTREGEVYAAVIRRLVTQDHTFGNAEPPFEVIYVLDGPVSGAGDPMAGTKTEPTEHFSDATKTAIRSRLADLPRLAFVGRRSDVVEGTDGGDSPGQVTDGGALVTLGPIEGEGTAVQVESSLWMNGLAGTWLTYAVALRDGEWRVTGTRGPVAIS